MTTHRRFDFSLLASRSSLAVQAEHRLLRAPPRARRRRRHARAARGRRPRRALTAARLAEPRRDPVRALAEVLGMTIPLYCLAVVAVLPYVCSWVGGLLPLPAVRRPRQQDPTPPDRPASQGVGARAQAAQANAWEALPFFTAAVVISHLAGADARKAALLSETFVVDARPAPDPLRGGSGRPPLARLRPSASSASSGFS